MTCYTVGKNYTIYPNREEFTLDFCNLSGLHTQIITYLKNLIHFENNGTSRKVLVIIKYEFLVGQYTEIHIWCQKKTA